MFYLEPPISHSAVVPWPDADDVAIVTPSTLIEQLTVPSPRPGITRPEQRSTEPFGLIESGTGGGPARRRHYDACEKQGRAVHHHRRGRYRRMPGPRRARRRAGRARGAPGGAARPRTPARHPVAHG